MKQIKNATLAILGGLLILSVATVSCSKKSSSPAAATATSFTPASAAVGATITISGTGFSGTATVTIGGVAATNVTVVNSTTITAVIPTGATSGAVVVTDGGSPLTVPGGSLTVTGSVPSGPTSDSVAKANLVAHWTFDASSVEQGSGVLALTGGAYNVGTVSYSNAGVIGNCATFTNGALVYPQLPQLVDTALESYTVSMWVKLGSRGTSPTWQSLFQLNSNAYAGLFGIIGVQILNQYSADTLPLQITQTQDAAQGPQVGGFGCGGCFNTTGISLSPNPIVYTPTSATAWTFLTTTYNGSGTNETLKEYANGVLLDTLVLTNVVKPATFRILPTGGTGAGAPSTWGNFVTIGTFNWGEFPEFSGTDGNGNSPTTTPPGYMSNGINGSLDDIRVFNTSLSVAQVDSLYTLGTAGK